MNSSAWGYQLLWALGDLWRKKVIYFLICIQLLFCLLFFNFTFDQFQLSLRQGKFSESLTEFHLVIFNQGDRINPNPGRPSDMQAFWQLFFQNETAYLLQPMAVDSDVGTIYLACGDFFKLNHIEQDIARNTGSDTGTDTEPKQGLYFGAMRDQAIDVNVVPDYLVPLFEELTFQSHLPRNTQAQIGSSVRSLDEAIVIYAKPSTFARLLPYYIEPDPASVLWSSPEPEALENFLEKNWQRGHSLIPQTLSPYRETFSQSLQSSGFISSAVFGSALVLVVIFLFLQTWTFLRQAIPDYRIHFKQGATPMHLSLRCFCTCMIMWLLPLLAYDFILVGPIVSDRILHAPLLIILIVLGIWTSSRMINLVMREDGGRKE